MLGQFFRFMVLRGTRTVPFAFDCFLPMQLERSLAQANQGHKAGSGGEIAARAVFVDIALENNVSYPTEYFVLY